MSYRLNAKEVSRNGKSKGTIHDMNESNHLEVIFSVYIYTPFENQSEIIERLNLSLFSFKFCDESFEDFLLYNGH